MGRTKVFFLRTRNSARRQTADALLRKYAGNLAEKSCPIFPAIGVRLYWPVEYLADFVGAPKNLYASHTIFVTLLTIFICCRGINYIQYYEYK